MGMVNRAAMALLFGVLAACSEQAPPPAPSQPEPVQTENEDQQPARSGGLSALRNFAESDDARELDMSQTDRSMETISPFRGLYLPEVRAAYDVVYAEVSARNGVKQEYEREVALSLRDLRLSLTPATLAFTIQCAAGIDVQGRRGVITPYEATYNSKFWLYSAFAELDERNDGSVAGFPEVVPGIERFPDRRRDFTPEAAVEPYRQQVYILYLLERDRQLSAESTAMVSSRVRACNAGSPPAINHYGRNVWTVQ